MIDANPKYTHKQDTTETNYKQTKPSETESEKEKTKERKKIHKERGKEKTERERFGKGLSIVEVCFSGVVRMILAI